MSATRLASSTSVRWPSWSAPIVGTNAMLFPCARWSATTWRISEIVPTTCISEAVLRVRIRPAADVARPCTDRGLHLATHLGVALEELRLEIVEAEHIGQNQHLAITARSE